MIFGHKLRIPRGNILLFPLIGMFIFVLLYVLAAIQYPGGSWRVPDSEGFSILNNYLCDLLDHYAINGELNNGRFLARAALGFLCGSLLLLWYFLPGLFPKHNRNLKIMWISGILALATTFFLSTGTHDTTVRIAGVFGVIAFTSCLRELYRIKFYNTFYLGIICLTVFMINYIIYETGAFIGSLPVVQKITFIGFISWFILLNRSLIEKVNLNQKKSKSLEMK